MTKRKSASSVICQCMTVGVLAATVLGCQPTSPPAPVNTNNGVPFPVFNGNLDQALESDACSTRMQDLEGVLASYMANNQNRLPQTLEELKEVPGLGPNVQLACPVTGQPYVYSAGGLYLPPESKDPRRIILWEPTPSHNGSRSCLLIPHIERGSAVGMEVKLIPEKEFARAIPPIQ